MFRAEVTGLSVAYEQAGRGPVVVLLHGFLFDSRAWRPQLEDLSNDFTVIAWDAPGAGQSADPPETFEMGDWADCLAGLLDVAGVGSAHILGLSWGGMLAQEFYRRQPQRVRSLVLADTYAGWRASLSDETSEERLATCLRDSSLPASELVPKYLPGMHSESATQEVREELALIMSAFHPVGFRLMALSSARSDTRDLLSEIRVPTLLIWGEADARSPMGVAHQFHDAIPGARLAVIPGAGPPQQRRSTGPVQCGGTRLLPVWLDKVTDEAMPRRTPGSSRPRVHDVRREVCNRGQVFTVARRRARTTVSGRLRRHRVEGGAATRET